MVDNTNAATMISLKTRETEFVCQNIKILKTSFRTFETDIAPGSFFNKERPKQLIENGQRGSFSHHSLSIWNEVQS